MKILTCQNDLEQLSQVSKPISMSDFHVADLCLSMWQVMKQNSGIGLAAPQIGHLLRLIVVDFEPCVLINPYIISAEGTQCDINEGCLSVPNIQRSLERFDTITVAYQEISGTQKIKTFSGLYSVVIQHEIDHLDGILITTNEEK